MNRFQSFSGMVTMIRDLPDGPMGEAGCFKLMTVEGGQGEIVHFVVEPTTYVMDHVMVRIGDRMTGFYDANVPVPLIYPPQYRAVVVAVDSPDDFVKVDYFNEQLVSSDGQLQLHISQHTNVLLENGQAFNGNLSHRNLIVIYGVATKSIPAQTTPSQIIVLC